MTDKELERRIHQCLTEGRYLTRREEGFLETLNDKLAMHHHILPHEREEVERIYAEKVP